MSDAKMALTLPEAAATLSISRGTLRSLIRSGQLRVVYLGPRCPRVSKRDLEQFLLYRQRPSLLAAATAATKPLKGRVTVTDAAMRLRVGYSAMRRMLISGEIAGGINPNNGRLYADGEAVEEALRERAGERP